MITSTVVRLSMAAGLVLLGSGVRVQTRSDRTVEEIRILRSIRLSREEATEFCIQPRTGFSGAQYEDKYSFAAVATSRANDGLVVDSTNPKVGSGHACFGPGANPATTNMYLEVELGGLAFRGSGNCTKVTSDFPESGLAAVNCVANLRALPEPYVGGLLTSSTMFSRKTIGPESEPPGYAQASIVTVRLWKKRDFRAE